MFSYIQSTFIPLSFFLAERNKRRSGRYRYLVLDGEECILDQAWIDGPAYDRAVPAG